MTHEQLEFAWYVYADDGNPNHNDAEQPPSRQEQQPPAGAHD
ncbi:MAG: hypothetical protein ACJ8C4_06750 [Gemmataceae bacterium]